MLQLIIAYGHLIMSVLICGYCLWRKDAYDKYYVMYFILLNLSWLIFNDECLISFIFKKLQDPGYSLGDTSDIKDVVVILGKPISQILLDYVIPLMYVINILCVVSFGKINELVKNLLVAGIISYCFYTYAIKANINKSSKSIIRMIHAVIFSTLLFTSGTLFQKN